MTPTILGLCGSLRTQSYNRKLLNQAVQLFGPCSYQEISLNLPLYDGDLEDRDGIPEQVQHLADAIKSADGIIVVGPEYNKGLSGALKNGLDWVSRVPGGVWKTKPVAVMSAASGRSGGETAQYMLRHCLTPFEAQLISAPMVAVANAAQEFDEEGNLTNERYLTAIKGLMAELRYLSEKSH
ncbi:MAG: NAD(P)H-dependent oxidoreductase [Paracoccaceae bacterium]|nr:NAD(P)H-dependent oxidoreductase [Paracoccaceae bacterium]